MAPIDGVHFAAYASEYRAILGRAQEVVAGFPPLLEGLVWPLLPELGGGSFSRIVALLPYWVANVLDELESPGTSPPASPPDQIETLGLASLLGWWSYLIQDELLDRELDQPELLPLAFAFHAAAVRLLEHVLPGHKAFWGAFEELSLTAAEAHCWEQRLHFQTFAELDGKGPDDWTFNLDDLDRLADRSALLQLTAVAQLALHGYSREHPLYGALTEMLRHYAIARQIGDDRSDWVQDLQKGRLNYVSARLLRRMVETGAVRAYAELDIEWMVGNFLCDDDLFADIQRVAMEACQQAARSIAPYHPRHLGTLVDALAQELESSYEAALDRRSTLRALFSPLAT